MSDQKHSVCHPRPILRTAAPIPTTTSRIQVFRNEPIFFADDVELEDSTFSIGFNKIAAGGAFGSVECKSCLELSSANAV